MDAVSCHDDVVIVVLHDGVIGGDVMTQFVTLCIALLSSSGCYVRLVVLIHHIE
jgi:hypothetical protein